MSDNILKIIATSPSYIPTEDTDQKLMALIKILLPHTERISIKRSKTIQFIDSGSNLENIICPNCNKKLDEVWWKEALDKSYQNLFSELDVIVPCCKSKLSLNELKYELPVGFAQFSVEILNPNSDISNEELQKIEEILDTKTRIIWAHY